MSYPNYSIGKTIKKIEDIEYENLTSLEDQADKEAFSNLITSFYNESVYDIIVNIPIKEGNYRKAGKN